MVCGCLATDGMWWGDGLKGVFCLDFGRLCDPHRESVFCRSGQLFSNVLSPVSFVESGAVGRKVIYRGKACMVGPLSGVKPYLLGLLPASSGFQQIAGKIWGY